MSSGAAAAPLPRVLAEALRHHLAGNLDEAAHRYRQILSVEARHADSLHLLGMIEYRRGRYESGAELIRRAIAVDANQPAYHSNLGALMQMQGKLDQAVGGYRRALALKPDYVEAWTNLGNALQLQGKLEEGVASHERALALKPDYADAHNNLGIALAAQGRTAEAIARYERALELKPEHANAHNNLGIALATQGRIAEAIVHYRRAIQLNPRHADAHNNLGIALAELDRIGEAIACYRRALSIQPGHADACNNLGNACKAEGKFDDARAHYARAVVLRPDHAEAHYNLSEIKTYHRGDAELAALEALAVRQGLSPGKTAYVHFALAKALEDAGDYVRAFEHLRQGNALWRSLIHYDEAATLALFRRISSIFDGSLLDRFRGAGDPSPVPVFVLGMPRSGSTLVEQILASHPQIHAAGERKHLEQLTAVLRAGDPPVPYPECVPGLDSGALRRIAWDYLATLPAPANGAIRMVDKLPGNFLNIGLIRLILPNARIIHTTRDPIDTCVSCYSKLFTSGLAFSFDLAELGRYYRGYRALMRHWRSVLPPGAMLEVSYERVVEDLETEARRMIEFCGLAWNDRCVAFHETSRIVRTASAAQVRQPLYRGSLQRSRKFEAGLVPLLRALEA